VTLIGYSRVSTLDQNPESQLDRLTSAGCIHVFMDRFSGTKASRPEWDKCRATLQAGDTLIITRLDRLGRSTKDLLAIASWLDDVGVNLIATEQSINTTTAEGRLFFTMVSAFAEFEHSLMVARTKDGLAAAKARGRAGGRPLTLSVQQAAEVTSMLSADRSVTEVAELFKVSRATIYRTVRAGA
jgi:DNA invertase Pin-like site-specific DNA recombinase